MRQHESVPANADVKRKRRTGRAAAAAGLVVLLGACSSGESGKADRPASSSASPSGSAASVKPSPSTAASTPAKLPYALKAGETCVSTKEWSNYEKKDWLGGLLGTALLTSSDVVFNQAASAYPGSGPLCEKMPIKVAFFALSGDETINIARNEEGLAIDGSKSVTVKLDAPAAAPVDPGEPSCDGSGTAVYIGDGPLLRGKDWPAILNIRDGGVYVTELGSEFGTGDRLVRGRLFCDGARPNPGAIGGPGLPDTLPSLPGFGSTNP